MKLKEIRESILSDIVIHALSPVLSAIKIVFREDMKDYIVHRVKTRSHHVVMVTDEGNMNPLLLVRQRGFFKVWSQLPEKAIPPFLAKELFSQDCSRERRVELLNKIMGLRAFW